MPIDPARTSSREKPAAILCLTENGLRLAERLAAYRPDATLYIPSRLLAQGGQNDEQKLSTAGRGAQENGTLVRLYFDDWQEAFREAFHNYSALICIMATGIVVRSLAPLMVSKLTDPAVVVMDENGEYVISLIAGHIGGANQLAREIAADMGGQAVITTASDVGGKAAVDLLAMEMDALIDPIIRIKTINRALVEAKTVYLYSPWPLVKIPAGFHWRGWPESKSTQMERELITARQSEPKVIDKLLEPAVLISPWKVKIDHQRELMQLCPRNLVLGVGCRKNISIDELEQALAEVMEQFSLDENCICKLASIDFKLQEAALQELAVRLKIPLQGFSAEEIRTLDGSYEPSEWVNQHIGVGGVCEPAARLASGGGIMLVPKQKRSAVTISVAMEKSWWWDWDRVSEIY